MSERKSVLVLCTGNSCRSQMAAAYLSAWASDRFRVDSAGTEPADAVHPLTRVVLAEDGLDLGSIRPNDYRRFLGEPVDYLIVVCEEAAGTCPSGWPEVGQRLPWTFDDPATFQGTDKEILVEFRRVRDEIKRRVRNWLEAA